MKKIVLDIETQNTFNEVGSRDPLALSISLLVVYDYTTDQYYSFLENEFSQLWKIIENADMIIGYNSDYFDIPLLNKYYPGDLTKIKSLDILAEIRKVINKRISLDSVAAGTLGILPWPINTCATKL
ncbi:MAG: DEAD/DEAH box helicase domain protein [Candidatus Falkowbacteria bacterium GW2011_GWA2_39_24]|uniref:DEAD/DEAH box helicase domain protein n=1 Tax=Candidatus Falkowbacteria bacterium GW2011_GWA2_39_24 TaxID=1618634 RepID=A0A0G0NAG8_9BACT|nr:MAG: DEAD/DEAH box helicase domain protein [Candidatus Falkowbacteria bacterium GW2011_GWA2_39_24]